MFLKELKLTRLNYVLLFHPLLQKHTSVLSQVHSCLSAQFPSSRMGEDEQQVNLSSEGMQVVKDAPLTSLENQEEGEEGVADGANKFYCYLCGITCHNQQVSLHIHQQSTYVQGSYRTLKSLKKS